MNEDASHLGLSRHEEGLEEIILHVDILVKQLAQGLLIDIAPEAHEGKLEETDHGRREDIDRRAVLLQIEKDRPVRQIFEDPRRLPCADFPDPRRPLDRERADGQLGDPRRIMFAEEDLQDPVEGRRRRRPLRKAVETIHQGVITGLHEMMTQ